MVVNVIMNKKYIIVIILILFFAFFTSFLKKDSDELLSVLNSDYGIFIYGDYITYLDVGDVYEEEGAMAIDEDGNNLSSKIITTYYTGNRQVFEIDSSYVQDYTVKYVASSDDKVYEAERVVIVRDIKPPKIKEIDALTINLNDVYSFDPTSRIVASDASGIDKILCDDVKKEISEQVIKCDVLDRYDNKNSIKFLVKIVN